MNEFIFLFHNMNEFILVFLPDFIQKVQFSNPVLELDSSALVYLPLLILSCKKD